MTIPSTTHQSIGPLPNQYLEIKNKLQSIEKMDFRVQGAQSIRNQVVKYGTLTFDPSAVLIMEELDHDFLVIYADLLDLKGPASIVRTNSLKLDGANGRNGADGPTILTGEGTPGHAGKSGEAGHEGGFQRVPPVFMFFKQVFLNGVEASPSDLKLAFNFDGYNGGNGGDGGRGGTGSNGRKGTDAVDGWLDCTAGAGHGGRGGDAGAGGMPGAGGNGSDGAVLRFFVDPGTVQILMAAKVSVAPGLAGRSGHYLGPGRPGEGGPPGNGSGFCSDEPGRKGARGNVFECRPPDFGASYGKPGPSPTIYGYTGWDELEYRNT